MGLYVTVLLPAKYLKSYVSDLFQLGYTMPHQCQRHMQGIVFEHKSCFLSINFARGQKVRQGFWLVEQKSEAS